MRPDALRDWPPRGPQRAELRVLPDPRWRLLDVLPARASARVDTYVNARAAWARHSGAIDHRTLADRAGAAEYLRELRPDLVAVHDPHDATRGLASAAAAVDACVVLVRHTPGIRGERRAAARCDAVAANGQTWEALRRHPDLAPAAGIRPAFRPRAEPGRGDHVLCVGAPAGDRIVLDVVAAAARSRDRWPLRIVGAEYSTSRVLRRVETLGLARRVSLRPAIGDPERLAQLYAGAACVVFPTARDDDGLAAVEAAACGAGVVVSAASAAASRLGRHAEVFAEGDVDGLLAAIGRARRAPRDLVRAAHLARRYDWDTAFAAELGELVALRRDPTLHQIVTS